MPKDLADDIAMLPLLALLPDISSVSRETELGTDTVMSGYFEITKRFDIGRLEAALFSLEATDYYEILAIDRAASQIAEARRRLTETALKSYANEGDPVSSWAEEHRGTVGRISDQIRALAGSGETSVPRLTVAAGLLGDLAK